MPKKGEQRPEGWGDSALEPVRYPMNYEIPRLRGKARDGHVRRWEAAFAMLQACGLDPENLPWRWEGKPKMGAFQIMVSRENGHRLGVGIWGGYNYQKYMAKLESNRERHRRYAEQKRGLHE